MKKLVTLLGVALFTATQVNSQVYVSVGIGQNVCFNSNDPYGLITNDKNNVSTLVSFNLGRGFEPRMNVGYMFSKHIGAELGLSYLMGQKNKITNVSGTTNDEMEMYARMVRIAPALVISAGFEKLNPYGKFGLNVGMGKIKTDRTNTVGSNKSELTWEDTGAKGIGMFGGFGLEYFLNKKAIIYLEVNASNLSISPTKGKFTKYTYNGTDQLAALTTSDKETEYVKELDNTAATPTSSPDKVLKPTFAMGANNFTLGFRFRF